MSAGPKIWTEDVIAERFELGYGQGLGPNYRPWVRVQEFSSRGTQTRVPCPLVNRTIHTFSYLERHMFQFLEFCGVPIVPDGALGEASLYDPERDLWSSDESQLADYREQFPLDRRVTVPAARRRGFRVPRYLTTGVPMVMYLDAMLTYGEGRVAE